MPLFLQTHSGEVKLSTFIEIVASQLAQKCSCSFLSNFIANGELTCEDRRTDRVILRGSLIGLDDNTSAALLHFHLQRWVDGSPSIEVTGVPLDILPCSTYPINQTICEPSSSTGEVTEPQTSTVSVGEVSEPQNLANRGRVSSSYEAGLGVVGVLILIAIVIVIIVLAVVCRKRVKSKKYR